MGAKPAKGHDKAASHMTAGRKSLLTLVGQFEGASKILVNHQIVQY